PGGHMTESVFFPEAELNFADNMLRGRTTDGPAIIFGNDRGQGRSVSWAELTAEVAAIALLLRDLGLRQQDRVAAILPNIPEAVSGFLATAAVGGIWAACSPDFGVEAILDRFTIIQPKILIATDGYVENGAICPIFDKIQQVVAGLPSLETVIWVRYTADRRDFDLQIQRLGKSISWQAARAAIGAVPLQCDALPFNAPLCILFTSGTTGPPKCLIHRAGGVLLQHLKEHQLHCDIRPGDRIFYYTSCAWVMWHWMSSALASGATLLLYDGSPYYPSPSALFSFAERHRATLFGISPRFLTDCAQIKLSPKNQGDLRHLRTVISTGSPLSAAMFDYVYEEIGHDLHLISIYGGTDIASCFGQGNPMAPVRAGEIQVPALGMAVDIVDPQGNALPHGVGELVCRAPFPSLPLGLWNDESGARYRETYFAQFPSMWRHADWAEWTPSGGLVVHGRADTTINPGGVRIGTSELYRVLEGLDFLRDFVAVGELADQDERILLFVVPRQRPDTPLPDPLKREIRHQISTKLSRHHVPQKILSVDAIPMTHNGKVAEAAVRNIIRGQPVENATALRNPESLAAIKAVFEGAKPG
ncbi:MAG: acetoacetate--CoA ligase, partial [Alphaproteobacteria bacterium]